jgi:NitT/TauT family transport system substrate-binding protein
MFGRWAGAYRRLSMAFSTHPLAVAGARHCAAAAIAVLAAGSTLAAAPEIRIGVLQYGTVNWELETIQRYGLAEREGVRLKIVPLALKDAASVALQGGAVDMIVSDWLWVARQRAEGRDFTFASYSRTVGNLVVRPDAGVTRFADLRGKRLGVAGGPLDKSWLLLRAWARKTQGDDAAKLVEPNFAAPPLLNQLLLSGELPAVLNFWHFSARLEAAGMRRLLDMDEILATLGIDGELPMLGWVFRDSWAGENAAALAGFLRASAAAKRLLAESDAVWEELRPTTRAENETTFAALRAGYRAGIPLAALAGPADADAVARESAAAETAARQAFAILVREGGEALLGSARELPPGVFWKAAAK